MTRQVIQLEAGWYGNSASFSRWQPSGPNRVLIDSALSAPNTRYFSNITVRRDRTGIVLHFEAGTSGGLAANLDLTSTFETQGRITLQFNDGSTDHEFSYDLAGRDTSEPYRVDFTGDEAAAFTAFRNNLPTSGTQAATLILDDEPPSDSGVVEVRAGNPTVSVTASSILTNHLSFTLPASIRTTENPFSTIDVISWTTTSAQSRTIPGGWMANSQPNYLWKFILNRRYSSGRTSINRRAISIEVGDLNVGEDFTAAIEGALEIRITAGTTSVRLGPFTGDTEDPYFWVLGSEDHAAFDDIYSAATGEITVEFWSGFGDDPFFVQGAEAEVRAGTPTAAALAPPGSAFIKAGTPQATVQSPPGSAFAKAGNPQVTVRAAHMFYVRAGRPTVSVTADKASTASIRAGNPTASVTAKGVVPGRAEVRAGSPTVSAEANITSPLAAPTLRIAPVPEGDEGTTVELSISLIGGNYDGLTELWGVSGGTLVPPLVTPFSGSKDMRLSFYGDTPETGEPTPPGSNPLDVQFTVQLETGDNLRLPGDWFLDGVARDLELWVTYYPSEHQISNSRVGSFHTLRLFDRSASGVQELLPIKPSVLERIQMSVTHGGETLSVSGGRILSRSRLSFVNYSGLTEQNFYDFVRNYPHDTSNNPVLSSTDINITLTSNPALLSSDPSPEWTRPIIDPVGAFQDFTIDWAGTFTGDGSRALADAAPITVGAQATGRVWNITGRASVRAGDPTATVRSPPGAAFAKAGLPTVEITARSVPPGRADVRAGNPSVRVTPASTAFIRAGIPVVTIRVPPGNAFFKSGIPYVTVRAAHTAYVVAGRPVVTVTARGVNPGRADVRAGNPTVTVTARGVNPGRADVRAGNPTVTVTAVAVPLETGVIEVSAGSPTVTARADFEGGQVPDDWPALPDFERDFSVSFGQEREEYPVMLGPPITRPSIPSTTPFTGILMLERGDRDRLYDFWEAKQGETFLFPHPVWGPQEVRFVRGTGLLQRHQRGTRYEVTVNLEVLG